MSFRQRVFSAKWFSAKCHGSDLRDINVQKHEHVHVRAHLNATRKVSCKKTNKDGVKLIIKSGLHILLQVKRDVHLQFVLIYGANHYFSQIKCK